MILLVDNVKTITQFIRLTKIFNHKHKIDRVEYKKNGDADFTEASYPKDVLDSFYFKIEFGSGVEVCAINENMERGCVAFDASTDFTATFTLDKNL